MTAMTRRDFLAAGAAGLGLAATRRARAAGAGRREAMATRPIPRTGERIPVIGLGTWRTFDVGPSESERAPLLEVLSRFFEGGGRVIDSSPMYGRAEEVVGDLVSRLRPEPPPFLATKVWTSGKEAGEQQMRQSMKRLRADRLDLMQIHNLLDWQTQLPTLRAWKRDGKLRHIGITHYSTGAMPEMERLLRSEQLDFVQLPYSAATREAEARLLPAAADTGTAVLVMRPFEQGELFQAVKRRPLPPWSKDIGAASWGQVLLKFILSHPAVTAVIPATANPKHLEDDVQAGLGPIPDAAFRRRMAEDLKF